jgi:hypothetical protein
MKSFVKKNIIFYILIFAVNSIILIAANYVVGNTISIPYELYETRRVFVPTGKVKNFDWDFLLERNVVLVAETSDSKVVGLYDPGMYYFVNSTKALDPRYLRYFSNEDYLKKTDTGVALINIDTMFKSGKLSPYAVKKGMKRAADAYSIDIIGALDIVSVGYGSLEESYPTEEFAVFKNIFTLKSNIIKKIYVDVPETEKIDELEKVSEVLKEKGFTEISENKAQPVIKACIHAVLNYRKYERFILYCAMASLSVFIYTSVIYLWKYKEYIYISRVCGTDFFKMYKLILKYSIFQIVLISMVASFGIWIYLGLIKEGIMSIFDYIVVDFIFLLLFLLCITGVYIFGFLRYSREMR